MNKYKIKKITKIHKLNNEQKKIYLKAFYSCHSKESIELIENYLNGENIKDYIFKELKKSNNDLEISPIEMYFFYDKENTLVGLISFFYNTNFFSFGHLLYGIELLYVENKNLGHGKNIIKIFEQEIAKNKNKQIKINLIIDKNFEFLSEFYEKLNYKKYLETPEEQSYCKIIRGEESFWI